MKTNLLFLTLFLFPTFFNAQEWNEIADDIFSDNQRVYSLKMVDDDIAWASSSDPEFGHSQPTAHRTIDGGTTWNSTVLPQAAGFTAWDIAPVDDEVAFLSVGQLYKTIDGGSTWSTVSSYVDFPVYVHFFDADNGIVVGASLPEFGLRFGLTSDGGATWLYVGGQDWDQPAGTSLPDVSVFPSIGYSLFNGSYDVEDDMIILNMADGNYWVSYDQGYNWEAKIAPMSSLGVLGSTIAIQDENSYMFAGDYAAGTFEFVTPFSFFTNDGGATWIEGQPGINTSISEYLEGTGNLFMISGQYGNSQGTVISNDYGQTWTYVDGTRILAADFSDSGKGIGVFGNYPTLDDFEENKKVYEWYLDPCNFLGGLYQSDSDCDGIIDELGCDLCPGVDDTVDNNNDGKPDCAFPPSYQDIEESWKCGNNKVLMTVNLNNPHVICVNKNAINAHISNGGYLGAMGSSNCGTNMMTENENSFQIEKVSHQDESSSVKVFPNPTSQILHIDLNVYYGKSAKIEVVDNLGRVFYAQNVSEIMTGIQEISVEEIPAGFYQVNILIDNEIRINKPFVVHRG